MSTNASGTARPIGVIDYGQYEYPHTCPCHPLPYGYPHYGYPSTTTFTSPSEPPPPRLSDEDVERIAEAIAKKLRP